MRIDTTPLVLVVLALSGCVVQTVPQKGDPGPQGLPGKDADEGELEELKARVDALEKKLENPECPVGYVRDGLGNPKNPQSIACYLGSKDSPLDRIVRVGQGATTFWIDAYEATLWDGPGADSQQASNVRADGLQITWDSATAQYIASPIYAWSRPNQTLPQSGVTWFQANSACAQSGKRLPTVAEWHLAAVGTFDPPDPNFLPGCLTSGAVVARKTGEGQNCRSYWGAEDMVGNVVEWTSDWYASPSRSSGTVLAPWPASFAGNGDQTNGVTSDAATAPGDLSTKGAPSGALHGGNFVGVLNAGIFTLDLAQAPSYSDGTIGFRCVIPR